MMSKYKERNKAQFQINSRGYIQYQIPGVYSQPLYGKNQKYISYGAKEGILADVVEAAELKQKLGLLNQDLEAGLFNPDDLYKYKYSKKQIRHLYQNRKSSVKLLDVFDGYTKFRFYNNDDGTGEIRYRLTFRPVLAKCPQQNITKAQEQRQIAEYMSQNACYSTVTCNLSILDRAVKRSIGIGDLPENTPNIFQEYLKEYKQIRKEDKKKNPKRLVEKGYRRDLQKLYWNKEEVKIIVDGFKNRSIKSPYYKKCDVLALLISFLFATGVRHGEAFGLKWGCISEDFVYATIRESYSSRIKKHKCTKTGESRTIQLSTGAQNILIKLKHFYQDIGIKMDAETNIFLKSNNKPFNNSDIGESWNGRNASKGHTEKLGVVTRLVLEGKLKNYIEPYSTRRTLTSLMAQKYQVKTVAKYIGDNPETILKHYYFAEEDFAPDNIF